MASRFDYIIIGAGSAGCVVANRLSHDRQNTVMLLEAGGKDRNPLVRLPMLMGKLFNSGLYNWNYHTEPSTELRGRSLFWPRGKVLGGSSTINGMVYIRGNRFDYDCWAQMGLSGWSYDDVLPVFRRSESHVQRSDAYHNRDGELAVCLARGANPLFDAFIKAGKQAGYPQNDDFNGAEQEGFGRFDFTIKDGKRWSAASAFLRPALERPNLSVVTDALVSRILLGDGRATGVEYAVGSETQTARANREIILCAGTINSPQILMLSGIGRGEELRKHGLPVEVELPGVGENLQDHVDCVVAYACRQPVSLYRNLRADRLIPSIMRGLLFGQGFATTFPYEAGAFVRSHEGLEAPDLQFHFMPALENAANLHFPNLLGRDKDEVKHGFSTRVGPLRPASRGCIRLRSSDPSDPPMIFPNYMEDEYDKALLIKGIRLLREVIAQPAFDSFRGKEMQPGDGIETDDALLSWLRESAMTTFHPVGTCKMGKDPLSVVDERLRLHGVENLRVADASIMPVIVGGNTNAPAIMIGEQAASFIASGE